MEKVPQTKEVEAGRISTWSPDRVLFPLLEPNFIRSLQPELHQPNAMGPFHLRAEHRARVSLAPFLMFRMRASV